MKKYLIMCLMTLCVLMLAACVKSEKYTVEMMIPAGSTADFVYSDTEICPTGNKITISSGAGLGDTEVILKPVEVKQKTAYEPAYLTHGMPVKMDVEKGGWFKIGVSVQNDSDSGPIAVSVDVEDVEVRIAAKADGAPLAPADPDLDLESVSHIEVMSGLTGQKITIKDADSVQKVMDDIESLRYEKKNTVEEVGLTVRII